MSRRETGPVTQEVMIALAKGFKETRPRIAVLRPQWLKDAAMVAAICKSFNASFLRDKFLKDCGATNGEERTSHD